MKTRGPPAGLRGPGEPTWRSPLPMERWHLESAATLRSAQTQLGERRQRTGLHLRVSP